MIYVCSENKTYVQSNNSFLVGQTTTFDVSIECKTCVFNSGKQNVPSFFQLPVSVCVCVCHHERVQPCIHVAPLKV